MKREKEDFYNMLKANGELFIFFEDMTGDWSKDKIRFIANYDNVMESLNGDDNDFNGIE